MPGNSQLDGLIKMDFKQHAHLRVLFIEIYAQLSPISTKEVAAISSTDVSTTSTKEVSTCLEAVVYKIHLSQFSLECCKLCHHLL